MIFAIETALLLINGKKTDALVLVQRNKGLFWKYFGLNDSVSHEFFLKVFLFTREYEALNKTNIFGEAFIDHVINKFKDTTKAE